MSSPSGGTEIRDRKTKLDLKVTEGNLALPVVSVRLRLERAVVYSRNIG